VNIILRALRRTAGFITACIVGVLLRLRYRAKTIGLDTVPRGIGHLVLANHPAEIDPLLLVVVTWTRFELRSVLLNEFYRLAYANWLFRISRCMPIPDLEVERSIDNVRMLRQCLADIAEGVRAGDHVLFYPSGRLYRSGCEAIGNASGLHLLLKRAPDLPVLLVRTRGFWGSSFSCANGDKPDLGKTLVRGIKTLLKNGILFSPRRKVTIEFQVAPADFPRHAARHELNAWLDAWFNEPGEEPLYRVPYGWW